MLKKLKEALQAKESLDVIRQRLDDQSRQIGACSEVIARLASEWDRARDEQEALALSTRKAMDVWTAETARLAEARKSLEEEAGKFAVLKHDLHTQLVGRFEKELAEQFRSKSDELRLATDNYRQLKGDVERAAGQLASLNESVARLHAVSSKIDAKDFELTHFAKQLLALDREKLELMRKLDTMERLVGSLRRRA